MAKFFETDSGKLIKNAEVDGYHIAERLMEGLMFQVEILEDDTLQVSVKEEDEPYFSQFNKEMFFNMVKDYVNSNQNHYSSTNNFYVPETNGQEKCWLVEKNTDGVIGEELETRPTTDQPTDQPTDQVVAEEEVEPDLGQYKTKKKYLNFISGVNGRKVRLNRKSAFISGKYFSGILDDYTFKITVKDESTIDFEVVDDRELPDGITIDRLIEMLDSKELSGYTQKYIVSEMPFKDSDDMLCYLETEEVKPIDKLATLIKGKTQISDKGRSKLASLFGSINTSKEDDDVEVEEDIVEEDIVEEEKSESLSYIQEQFIKMNEDKINEIKNRIATSETNIEKFQRDIKSTESKLDKEKEALKLLEDRLESFEPMAPSNGYVFMISEERKDSELTLDDKTIEVATKISQMLNLKADLVIKNLTDGYYEIKLGNSNDIESKLNLTRELSDLVDRIDLTGEFKLVNENTVHYIGKLNWHQLTQRMLKLGFEQDPEFDRLMNSNSYSSEFKVNEKFDPKDPNEILSDIAISQGMNFGEFSEGIQNGSIGEEKSTELEENPKLINLRTFDEPTDIIIVGMHSENQEDAYLTDDESQYKLYKGNKCVNEYITSDGFLNVYRAKDFLEYMNSLNEGDTGSIYSDSIENFLDFGEIIYVPNYKGGVNIGVVDFFGNTYEIENLDMIHYNIKGCDDIYDLGADVFIQINEDVDIQIIADMEEFNKIFNQGEDFQLDYMNPNQNNSNNLTTPTQISQNYQILKEGDLVFEGSYEECKDYVRTKLYKYRNNADFIKQYDSYNPNTNETSVLYRSDEFSEILFLEESEEEKEKSESWSSRGFWKKNLKNLKNLFNN